jgi:hypothetical protein
MAWYIFIKSLNRPNRACQGYELWLVVSHGLSPFLCVEHSTLSSRIPFAIFTGHLHWMGLASSGGLLRATASARGQAHSAARLFVGFVCVDGRREGVIPETFNVHGQVEKDRFPSVSSN